MNRLANKVAMITGAGSGVGRACMALFAAEGARVLGVGRTKQHLDETLADLERHGGQALTVTADLSQEAAAEHVMSAALDAYGRLDILVNAAGVGYSWGETSPGSMADLAN